MDVFISNLDSKVTRDKLKDSLAPILHQLQIHVFDVRKAVGKTFATLTLTDTSKAQNLLAQANKNPALFSSPSGRQALFRPSRKPIDAYLLRALRKEEKDRQDPHSWQKSSKLAAEVQDVQHQAGLKFTSLQCGRWETTTERTVFIPYYELQTNILLKRDGRALVAQVTTPPSRCHDLVFDLTSILAIAVSVEEYSSTLTISMALAPRIYEVGRPSSDDPYDRLLEMMDAVFASRTQTVEKFRDNVLPGLDPTVASSCLSYAMIDSSRLTNLERSIKSMTSRRVPITMTTAISAAPEKPKYSDQLASLNLQIAKLECSFAWRFQVHALWANGILSPAEVERLLPTMSDLRARSGETALITVLRRLNLQLSRNDATTDPQAGGVKGALSAIAHQASLLFEENESQSPARDEVSIHRVTVTPTGVYLYGPELVASNRVLRQYRTHSDCFLRVLFSDEDGTRIEFERDCSNERILQGRFLSILCSGLNIAREHFDFLGFSHSSLRSQTCWFMRPFIHDGTLLFAKDLISKLGDFSLIRCPAKCAARIGQAFSETTNAIRVEESIVHVHADVEIGGYVFTNGCGTISQSMWKQLRGNVPPEEQPTSYQIRYKGEQMSLKELS